MFQKFLNQNSCVILFRLAIFVPEKKKKISEAKPLGRISYDFKFWNNKKNINRPIAYEIVLAAIIWC